MSNIQRGTRVELAVFVVVSMLLCTWGTSATATQFLIDPGTSTIESQGGFVGFPNSGPMPLSGTINIEFDLDENTATLLSIDAAERPVLFRGELMGPSLLDIPVPIVENRFVLELNFSTRFEFLLIGDTLEFSVATGPHEGISDGIFTFLVGSAQVVPEPSTALLMGLGLVGLGARRRSN